MNQERKFPDPLRVAASEYIPGSLQEMFDFCALVWLKADQYRATSRRVVSHFLTDLEFDPVTGDKKEHKRFRDFMVDQLDFYAQGMTLGEDLQVYGNAFRYIYVPFTRSLIYRGRDKRDEISLLQAEAAGPVTFDLETLRYEIADPADWSKPEGRRGRLRLPFVDRYSQNLDDIRIRPLDPRDIVLDSSDFSGYANVLWTISSGIRTNVSAGRLTEINHCPMDLLAAIRDNKGYKFYPGEVFHLRNQTITGLTNGAWGIPDLLFNYGAVKQLLIYRGVEEAIGRDFMLPIRAFVPMNSSQNVPGGSGMPIINQAEFRASCEEMVARHRADPTAIFSFGLPVQMMEFGKDGKFLIPGDLMDKARQNLNDGVGYPLELQKGSLTIQQVPVTLRLFERSHVALSTGLSSFASWICRKVRAHQEQDDFHASLSAPSTADDVERKQLVLQMVQAGMLTREKGLASALGIENGAREELERMREDAELELESHKLQIEQQRNVEMLSMDSAAGEAGGGGGGGGGGTPLNIMDEARAMAAEYVTLPPGESHKALQMLESQDPQMHALVKQKMEERRSESESAGRASLRQ